MMPKQVLEHSEDPCSDDGPLPYNICMDKELAFIEQHLDAFMWRYVGLRNEAGLATARRAERTGN
jgi:hypothetical protein